MAWAQLPQAAGVEGYDPFGGVPSVGLRNGPYPPEDTSVRIPSGVVVSTARTARTFSLDISVDMTGAG